MSQGTKGQLSHHDVSIISAELEFVTKLVENLGGAFNLISRISEPIIMSDPREALDKSIQEQGNKIRQLKTEKAEKAVIDAEVAILKDLKAQLAATDGTAAAADASKKPKEKVAKNSFTLKVAKV